MAKNNSEVAPKCDFIHIHPQIVGIVSDQMLSESVLSALSELYKMFGDKTRIRILYVLLKHERREGKTVFYSLADEHVEMILNMGLEHVLEPEVNA